MSARAAIKKLVSLLQLTQEATKISIFANKKVAAILLPPKEA